MFVREVPVNFAEYRGAPCLERPAFRVWITPTHFQLRGYAIDLETHNVDDITDLARSFCRHGRRIEVDGDEVSLARVVLVLDALAGVHCETELLIESKELDSHDLCCG